MGDVDLDQYADPVGEFGDPTGSNLGLPEPLVTPFGPHETTVLDIVKVYDFPIVIFLLCCALFFAILASLFIIFGGAMGSMACAARCDSDCDFRFLGNTCEECTFESARCNDEPADGVTAGMAFFIIFGIIGCAICVCCIGTAISYLVVHCAVFRIYPAATGNELVPLPDISETIPGNTGEILEALK